MNVPPHIVLQKKRGETPLQTIEAWKRDHPEFAQVPAAYGGRLDPMASGKLLVLLGDECKKLKNYTGLDKEYTIEVLLDVETDSGDALGLATYAQVITPELRVAQIRHAIKAERGTHRRPYPVFSSKTVKGKPLFLYALEHTLDTIAIPEHDETIYKIEYQGSQQLSKEELQAHLEGMLAHIPRSDEPSKILGADFRQDAVRTRWQELLASMPERPFTILTLRVTCGSGTYMRTLAKRFAEHLGTAGIALSIDRTRIGTYMFGIWTKQY